jgi:hypothetical protein
MKEDSGLACLFILAFVAQLGVSSEVSSFTKQTKRESGQFFDCQSTSCSETTFVSSGNWLYTRFTSSENNPKYQYNVSGPSFKTYVMGSDDFSDFENGVFLYHYDSHSCSENWNTTCKFPSSGFSDPPGRIGTYYIVLLANLDGLYFTSVAYQDSPTPGWNIIDNYQSPDCTGVPSTSFITVSNSSQPCLPVACTTSQNQSSVLTCSSSLPSIPGLNFEYYDNDHCSGNPYQVTVTQPACIPSGNSSFGYSCDRFGIYYIECTDSACSEGCQVKSGVPTNQCVGGVIYACVQAVQNSTDWKVIDSFSNPGCTGSPSYTSITPSNDLDLCSPVNCTTAGNQSVACASSVPARYGVYFEIYDNSQCAGTPSEILVYASGYCIESGISSASFSCDNNGTYFTECIDSACSVECEIFRLPAPTAECDGNSVKYSCRLSATTAATTTGVIISSEATSSIISTVFKTIESQTASISSFTETATSKTGSPPIISTATTVGPKIIASVASISILLYNTGIF